MKCIEELAVSALLPGMVVGEAVVDDAGRILIPAGVELTENHIASLVRRELCVVKIEREVVENPLEREAYRLGLIERMDQIFRHTAEDDQVSRALYQAIFDYRMEQRS